MRLAMGSSEVRYSVKLRGILVMVEGFPVWVIIFDYLTLSNFINHFFEI